MSNVDLVGELYAAQGALSRPEKERLLRAGVDGECIAWGWVGSAGTLFEGDRWQPLAGGRRAFVAPVRVGDPDDPQWPQPDDIARYGDLVDLVAFTLEHPDRWALRTGNALWLGSIEPQFVAPDPVQVHRHPLGWLRAGGVGLVPLSRRPNEIRHLLLGCNSISVADVQHGKELRRLLEKPFRIPSIFVETPEKRTAA